MQLVTRHGLSPSVVGLGAAGSRFFKSSREAWAASVVRGWASMGQGGGKKQAPRQQQAPASNPVEAIGKIQSTIETLEKRPVLSLVSRLVPRSHGLTRHPSPKRYVRRSLCTKFIRNVVSTCQPRCGAGPITWRRR